jgi:UDP-N-acetylglucosamine 2-epimerase (non-hydrolysing)
VLRAVEPQPYLDFMHLVRQARTVVTDSCGITKETTVLGIACLTLRDATERPETVTVRTNELIGTDPVALAPVYAQLNAGNWKKGAVPSLWDRKTGQRIAATLGELLMGWCHSAMKTIVTEPHRISRRLG